MYSRHNIIGLSCKPQVSRLTPQQQRMLKKQLRKRNSGEVSLGTTEDETVTDDIAAAEGEGI